MADVQKEWQHDTRAAAPRVGDTSAPTGRDKINLTQRGWEHASAATRLLERRRAMFEVQEKLEYQKEASRQKEAEFKKREEQMEEKDVALQEHLLKFSKFLQKKDTQRICADKKANDEIKIREQKEVEIAELKAKLARLKQKRDSVQGELKLNMKYKTTLDEVVEFAKDDYNEIQDVVDRWTTLDTLHSTLDEGAKCGAPPRTAPCLPARGPDSPRGGRASTRPCPHPVSVQPARKKATCAPCARGCSGPWTARASARYYPGCATQGPRLPPSAPRRYFLSGNEAYKSQLVALTRDKQGEVLE